MGRVNNWLDIILKKGRNIFTAFFNYFKNEEKLFASFYNEIIDEHVIVEEADYSIYAY